jgi:hypothetical protein
MTYQCPVCLFDGLTFPPADHKICVCCGTQFGLDDFDYTVEELRARSLASGARWFSQHSPRLKLGCHPERGGVGGVKRRTPGLNPGRVGGSPNKKVRSQKPEFRSEKRGPRESPVLLF